VLVLKLQKYVFYFLQTTIYAGGDFVIAD